MILIEKVLIENFQSHESTELTFNGGLNVIIGPSDHGKSAVIRAIKWVLYNEPRGNEFIRQGSNFARVTLWLNTGYAITRERTPSKNRYILSDSDGNSNIYEGFGNEVPQEVVKAHGIPKVIMDTDINSSINIGNQLEGPFLISESGAVRAKAIGRLTGLHIIDKSIRDSGTDLRRENQTRDRFEKELDEVNEKLKEYEYLDVLEEKIEASSKLIEKIEKGLERIASLTNIKQNLKDIDEKYKQTVYEIAKLEKIEECDIILKNIEVDFIKLKSMDNLSNRFSDNLTAEKEMEKTLSMTEGVSSCKSLLKQAEEKVIRYEKLQKAKKVLKDLENELVNVENILNRTKNIQISDGMISKIGENNIRVMQLIAIKEKLLDYDREIDKVHTMLDKSIDLTESDAIISEIVKKSERLVKLEAIGNRLAPILNNIIDGSNYLNSNNEEIEKKLKIYTDLLKESGKCPMCNSKISDDKLDDIIRHYKEAH